MKTNHTPGPWSLEYDGSICMGNQIVSTPIAPDGSTREERMANSALIAAAPELLEALIACESALRLVERETGNSYSATFNAIAAIAKATGSAS